MSCPDFSISQAGRRGMGVVQPQSGLDYPLRGPAIADDGAAYQPIRYLLADFYLEYDDMAEYHGGQKIVHPLRLKYLYGIGCVENSPPNGFPAAQHDADIVVVDSAGRTVIDTFNDTTTTFLAEDPTAPLNSDYRVYTWKTATAFCRLVAHTTWAESDGDKQQYDKYLAPTAAWFDERAIYRMPRRLLSVRVKNDVATSDKFAGNIVFVNGYNTEIIASPTETAAFRNNTNITISMAAGSGAGAYRSCADTNTAQPITTINGVAPDAHGDFLLSGKDCLWVRRPTVYQGSGASPSAAAQQQIGANCPPCCSCADYANTATYMNTVSLRYKLIGQRVDNIRSYHEENVARWNDQRECSLLRPLRLIFVPQRCPYIDVIMLLCNPCDTCIPATTLQLLLTTPTELTTTLECGYTALFATGVGGRQVTLTPIPGQLGYTANLPQIKPGDNAYIKTRLKFMETPAGGGEPHKPYGPYAITGYLTATISRTNEPFKNDCDGPDAVVAQAETTQTLYCNELGQTDAPC